MISFFFKKPTITIDCFTYSTNSYRYFKIEKAVEFIPNWWKRMKPDYKSVEENNLVVNRSTIKRCPSLMESYQHGFILPLWSDLVMEVRDKIIVWKFADKQSHLDVHHTEQMPAEFGQYVHAKLVSPWTLREKQGVNFTWSQPSWNMIDSLMKYHILPGTLEFQHNHGTHINILLKNNTNYFMEAGTPMVHMVPISDKNIELKHHLVDFSEIEKKGLDFYGWPFFQGAYRKTKAILSK